MELAYYHPYLVYHKDYDENNLVMIPYDAGVCESKESAKNMVNSLANSFFISRANNKLRIRIKIIDDFPLIMKQVKLRWYTIAYTNIGEVYRTSDNELLYLNFTVKRVGNTFRVYNPDGKFIGLSEIDRDDIKALNQALLIVDTSFHTLEHIKSILNTEVGRKIKDVY